MKTHSKNSWAENIKAQRDILNDKEIKMAMFIDNVFDEIKSYQFYDEQRGQATHYSTEQKFA